MIAYTQMKKVYKHGFKILGGTHICVKWLLIVSYLPCTQAKNLVAVNSKRSVVHVGFWKLCMAALHVETVHNIHDVRLKLDILASTQLKI